MNSKENNISRTFSPLTLFTSKQYWPYLFFEFQEHWSVTFHPYTLFLCITGTLFQVRYDQLFQHAVLLVLEKLASPKVDQYRFLNYKPEQKNYQKRILRNFIFNYLFKILCYNNHIKMNFVLKTFLPDKTNYTENTCSETWPSISSISSLKSSENKKS